MEIEVLASSSRFEAGTSLRVDVSGRDAARYPGFGLGRSVNRGIHSIHTGGQRLSLLLAAFVKD